MDHIQGGQQAGQFLFAVEQRTRQGFASQASAVEFAVEALLHLFQMVAQQLGQLGTVLELFAGGHAQQYRQGGFQGVSEVAQRIA